MQEDLTYTRLSSNILKEKLFQINSVATMTLLNTHTKKPNRHHPIYLSRKHASDFDDDSKERIGIFGIQVGALRNAAQAEMTTHKILFEL